MTKVTRKLVCLVQHGNCRYSLLVYIKVIEWGMTLLSCLHVCPPLLVVPCIEHSDVEVLTYSPGLTELASVDYFITTS